MKWWFDDDFNDVVFECDIPIHARTMKRNAINENWASYPVLLRDFPDRVFQPSSAEFDDGGKADDMNHEDHSMKNEEDGLRQRFLFLYRGHYRRMYLFAKTLIPQCGEIEDILQEVSLVLWKKFPSFRPDSSFISWAFQVIRIEVQAWQRKNRRNRRFLEEDFVDMVAARMMERGEKDIDRRYELLLECSETLSSRMKDMITQRYFKKRAIGDIAEQTNRSVGAVEQQLFRIRRALKICIAEKMKE